MYLYLGKEKWALWSVEDGDCFLGESNIMLACIICNICRERSVHRVFSQYSTPWNKCFVYNILGRHCNIQGSIFYLFNKLDKMTDEAQSFYFKLSFP